jgi:hypothetical protein
LRSAPSSYNNHVNRLKRLVKPYSLRQPAWMRSVTSDVDLPSKQH